MEVQLSLFPNPDLPSPSKLGSNNRKLTSEQAYRIKYDGEGPTKLARELGISKKLVENIRKELTWRHI